MRISLEGTLVELAPENETEVKELSVLWDFIVDCASSNRKLVPVGEFSAHDPARSKVARFNMED
jgi:hypothetical protein